MTGSACEQVEAEMQATLSILIPICLTAAGILLAVFARRHQYHEQVMARLYAHEAQEGTAARRFYRSGIWKTLLRRAGMEPRLSTAIGILSTLVITTLAGFVFGGGMGLLIGLLAGISGVILLGYIAVRRHQQQLLAQLPSFLDHIIRSLKTGNSLTGAFRDAAAEASGTLAPVMRQAVRYMDLGYDVGEAVTEVARIHQLREISIMALAMRVNMHYGGSAAEILQSLIELIHRRERIRRQLRALTSETRFSAIVLGAMPLLIGGYMIAVNPDYILTLWEHDRGHWVMLGALAWQATGLLLLWRMVRSLG